MATHLWAADVRAGSHVAIWAEFPCVDRGVARDEPDRCSDGRRRTLGSRFASPESSWLATTQPTFSLATAARPRRPESLAEGGGPRYIGSLDGSVGLPDVRDGSSAWSGAPIDGDRIGLMQFTSGSTGLPKGVQLREGAVAALGASCASRWFLTPADRVLGVFSLAHNAGSTYTTMAAFTAGAAVISRPAGGRQDRGRRWPTGPAQPSCPVWTPSLLTFSQVQCGRTVCVSSSAALTRRLLSASSAS